MPDSILSIFARLLLDASVLIRISDTWPKNARSLPSGGAPAARRCARLFERRCYPERLDIKLRLYL